MSKIGCGHNSISARITVNSGSNVHSHEPVTKLTSSGSQAAADEPAVMHSSGQVTVGTLTGDFSGAS